MAKIKKKLVVTANEDRDTMMNIEFDVDINADGLFTTTLKPEDTNIIKSYGVHLEPNKAKRLGFFKDETMAGLCHQIHNVLKQCLESKVVSNTPIIKYYIKTYCAYCLNNQTGDIVPNGKTSFVGEGGYKWIEGTSQEAFYHNTDFGIKVFVQPYMKRIIEYPNGKQKIFYDVRYEWEKGSNMEWLNELTNMKCTSLETLQEIEGTEENARFFVNIIKQICRINEKIADIIKNDKLEQMIQSTLKHEHLVLEA